MNVMVLQGYTSYAVGKLNYTHKSHLWIREMCLKAYGFTLKYSYLEK